MICGLIEERYVMCGLIEERGRNNGHALLNIINMIKSRAGHCF